jgi:response regulator RpfG family c-di-GMP phosphodiesterase
VSASASPVSKNKKVGDLLLALKVVTPEQYEVALKDVEGTPDRIEDAVIFMGYATEGDVLKAMAAHHKTRFVTSDKLAKAEIARATMEMVPRRVAETFGIFPVMFDAQKGVLSVVTADPDDVGTLQEIKMVSGAKEVLAFVARPAAVRAAIAKSYGGDIHAFALLDHNAQKQFRQMLDVYERNLVSDTSMATSLSREGSARERMVTEGDLGRPSSNPPPARNRPSDRAERAGSAETVLELLNVLITLLENARPDLRGHSALVARLTRRLAERINLSAASANACVAAAYLHDLGKMSAFHLTPLNVGEYEGHKLAAVKGVATPMRLLEGVKVGSDTRDAVQHMYERYDGKGFPNGMSAKDIPLGSRLLAITDTYADLTQNPKNPFRRALSSKEACDVLVKYKNAIFDPHLVDLFKNIVLGEDIRAKLLANRYEALLVDADPEETTVLELRMIEQGFEVKTARSAEQAMKMLHEAQSARTGFDLVVSELDLPQADGLTFLAEVRKNAWAKDLSWVVLTRRKARTDAQTAFDLGVIDFVAKPAPTEVFVAKLKTLMDQKTATRGGRGVSGSLREMSLPDIVQILFHGRKSGNLKIRHGSDTGEIHVLDGAIWNALWGALRGEEAFYAMLKLTDGEFGLEPQFRPDSRVIHQSSEALLLEGMRRLDEGVG